MLDTQYKICVLVIIWSFGHFCLCLQLYTRVHIYWWIIFFILDYYYKQTSWELSNLFILKTSWIIPHIDKKSEHVSSDFTDHRSDFGASTHLIGLSSHLLSCLHQLRAQITKINCKCDALFYRDCLKSLLVL